jgi:hypothetical protein
MRPRNVLLVGVFAMTSGWYLAVTVGPQSTAGGETRPRGPRPLGVEAFEPREPYSEQLRLRLERQPPTPRPTRNPFVFDSRRPSAADRPARDNAREEPTGDPAAEEARTLAGPVFVLSGMATKMVDGRPEYTAIIHDGRDLHFAKVGDQLPGGFAVVAATETMVTLRDESGGERSLRLP